MPLPGLHGKEVHYAIQPRLRHSNIGRATGFEPLPGRLVLRSARDFTGLGGSRRSEAQPGEAGSSGPEQLAASAPRGVSFWEGLVRW
jgi:hypothetical protein